MSDSKTVKLGGITFLAYVCAGTIFVMETENELFKEDGGLDYDRLGRRLFERSCHSLRKDALCIRLTHHGNLVRLEMPKDVMERVCSMAEILRESFERDRIFRPNHGDVSAVVVWLSVQDVCAAINFGLLVAAASEGKADSLPEEMPQQIVLTYDDFGAFIAGYNAPPPDGIVPKWRPLVEAVRRSYRASTKLGDDDDITPSDVRYMRA